eukprot:scaffold23883_cov39-Phaeocystis_antarctica.AAC.3
MPVAHWRIGALARWVIGSLGHWVIGSLGHWGIGARALGHWGKVIGARSLGPAHCGRRRRPTPTQGCRVGRQRRCLVRVRVRRVGVGVRVEGSR